LPHQELHLCCFWAAEPPIQDSRFKILIDLHDESTCNITQQMKVVGWRLEGLDKDLHKVFFDLGAGTSSNFVR
jgi:hypothetical protein